jgi:hypothetical protein
MKHDANPFESPHASDSNLRPVWVRLGLWRVPTRKTAVAWMWIALAIAVLSLIVSYWVPRAFIGVVMLGAAIWYACAIWWMDRHGQWQ